ncbi:SH3 domain-containing protein [Alkalibacterium pelagium]|uniref:D-alanyl-D-alanine dipeptidase n=1 Tax=Alkalibacterium pelagium TaxID=426702 RepID=A0A1H7HSI1_9LACT|nr:SH3 domain-containing protein [Alkalibacterium pelagium]GEN50374.1 hypothetical protein APE02nite_10390 [Alkalibacterium pelagium]SEK52627.1 D-alanyl-D-alanine dipeptidase [Alkalibacterium pelagium]
MNRNKPLVVSLLVGLIVMIGVIAVLWNRTSTGFPDPSEVTNLPQEEPTEPDTDAEPGETEQEEPAGEEPEEQVVSRYEESMFDLPVIGAGGFTSVNTHLRETASEDADSLTVLPAGTPFYIIEEQGNWWHVRTENQEGWLSNQLAFINLPDVLPSAIYDNPNTYGSIFRSSYTDIPGITGEVLYEGYGMNDRLGRDEFIMPIIYSTAHKIAEAQQAALENNETLVIMEVFRPSTAQVLVNERLSELAEQNDEVMQGLTEAPWTMNWFINEGVSNHQRGLAVDLTLARVESVEERIIDHYIVPQVTEYATYDMYSPIFELSTASAMLERPIAARDRVGWQNIPYMNHVNEEARRLEAYMFEADLIPIASEWWHFNDIDVLEEFEDELGDGNFHLDTVMNHLPSEAGIVE